MGEEQAMQRNWKKNNVSMMKIFRIIKDLELHAEEPGLQGIEMYFKKRNYMIKSS